MDREHPEVAQPTFRLPRLRFSLFNLLLLMVIFSLLLALYVRPEQCVAVAVIQLNDHFQRVLGSDQPGSDRSRYETLRKSDANTIRSQSVILSALRNPSIAAIPIIKQQTDPVDWLQTNLEVGFPQDLHLLTISLRGTAGEQDDLMRIASAVAQATNDHLNAIDPYRRDNLLRKTGYADELREKLKKLLIIQQSPSNERGTRVDDKELKAEIDLIQREWTKALDDLNAIEANKSSQ